MTIFKKYNFLFKVILWGGLLVTLALLSFLASHQKPDLISLFPFDHYNQNIGDWIKTTDPDYEKPLLNKTTQQEHMDSFYKHYFGLLSPWEPSHVNKVLQLLPPDDLKSHEERTILNFDNHNKPEEALGFGLNFHPYTEEWIRHLSQKIQISQFTLLHYQAKQRAITIDNVQARSLPTDDVFFYNPKRAGEGYPFDNLQMSSLWAGTPLYVLGETDDHAWSFILSPELVGWVKTNSLAYVNAAFIHQWQKAAKKNMAALIQTQTPVIDENGKFRFSGYLGSVFPAWNTTKGIRIMLAAADANQKAVIKYALLKDDQAALMPLQTTPQQFSKIIAALINRPYGWGGLYFYNDCSAELKSLFTPFGIWLPRHSTDQVNAGRMVDLSARTPEERLAYLREQGKPFLTLVYIGNHIVLSLGTYSDPENKKPVLLTYQNLWGLKPNPPLRRAVIGKAILFPFLLSYPEDPELISQAAKEYFQLTFLDQLPDDRAALEKSDIKTLMSMS